MMMHMTNEEAEGKSLKDIMIFDMISAEYEALFARKVMDVIIERNDDDINTWEYPVNDRLRYFLMEADFESGCQTFTEIKYLYEKIYGKLSEESERAIRESANQLAEEMIVKHGWRKEKEA